MKQSTIIAERLFELRLPDGSVTIVKVALQKPQPDPLGPDWVCRVLIDEPDKQTERRRFGIDSLQALSIGLETLWLEVDRLKHMYGDRITLYGDSELHHRR